MNVTIPLPTYRSHKLVQALKIGAIIPNPRGVELHFEDERFCPIEVDDAWVNKHAPQPGGYFVVYPGDGYRSWSPADAFEAGYTPVHGAGIAADAMHELRELAASGELSSGVLVPAEPTHSRAALDVLAERRRQVEAEGWTPEHDDEHENGEMAVAAGYYALACGWPHERDIGAGHKPQYWPWDASWWKPSAPRRNLVKAAALLLAEIERIDRAAAERGGA